MTRKVGEKFYIGESIIVTVAEVSSRGDRVRLQIECPPDVPVYRHDAPPADQQEGCES